MSDKDIQEQLLTLLKSASRTPRFDVGAAYDGGYGEMEAAMQTHAPGQLTQGLPGLILGQLFGGPQNIPSILSQNFHLKPRQTGSALYEALLDQNTENVRGLSARVLADQNARVQGLFFGENSLFTGIMNDESTPEDIRGGMRWIKEAIDGTGNGFQNGLGMFARPMLNQLLTNLTGYDIGGSANVINARSMGTLSGMRATHGFLDANNSRRGIFEGGKFNFQDVLSQEYADARSATSNLAYEATQGLTWERDAQGRITGRNRRANGASEKLVGDIMTRAIRENALDRYMESGEAVEKAIGLETIGGEDYETTRQFQRIRARAQHSKTVRELAKARDDAAKGKGNAEEVQRLERKSAEEISGMKGMGITEREMGDLSFASVAEEQARIFQEQRKNDEEASRIRTELDKKKNQRSDAEKNGKDEEFARLDEQVQQLTKSLDATEKKAATLADAAKKMGGIVKTAGDGLTEAVTATVDSLKDLYGDETQAARALDAMTGGRGFTDEAGAKALKRQIDEYKVTALAAGVDLTDAGKYLTQNAKGVASRWGTDRMEGSNAANQLAMNMSTMGMRGAVGISDPREQRRFLNAVSEMSAEVGDSRGFKTATLLEYARQENMFAGQEDKLKEIMQLMQSADSKDFDQAEAMIQTVIGGGSRGMGKALMQSPQALAYIMNKVNPEGQRNAAEWTVNTHGREMRREINMQQRKIRESEAATSLRESGVSRETINNITDAADKTALQDALRAIGQEKGREGDAKFFQDRFNTIYEQLQEKYKDDPNGVLRAGHEAAIAFMREGKEAGYLSEADATKIYETISTGRVDAMETYADQVGSISLKGNMTSGADMFRKAGVVGESETLTRANLGKAAKRVFGVLKTGTLKDRNGTYVSQDAANKELERINKMLSSDDPKQVEAAWQTLTSQIGSLDETSQGVISRVLKNTVYDTPEARAERKRRGGLTAVEEGLVAAGFSESIAPGVSTDSKFTYGLHGKEMVGGAVLVPRTSEDEAFRKNIAIKEQKGFDAKEGLAQKFVEFLSTGNFDKFIDGLDNAGKGLEQLVAGIAPFLELLGVPLVNTGKGENKPAEKTETAETLEAKTETTTPAADTAVAESVKEETVEPSAQERIIPAKSDEPVKVKTTESTEQAGAGKSAVAGKAATFANEQKKTNDLLEQIRDKMPGGGTGGVVVGGNP